MLKFLLLVLLILIFLNFKDDEKIDKKDELKKHQKNLMTLFDIFIKFAKKHNLVWWATGGTLLGAIRGNNIIEWDDDIDIEVPPPTIDFLRKHEKELNSEGLLLELDDRIWRIRYLKGETGYIDLFEVQKEGDLWKYVDKHSTKIWPNSYFKNEEVFPLKPHKFGDLTIDVPSNPVPYLERQYGDWKTPVKEPGHYGF